MDHPANYYAVPQNTLATLKADPRLEVITNGNYITIQYNGVIHLLNGCKSCAMRQRNCSCSHEILAKEWLAMNIDFLR
jgi:hypothetical protein